MSSRKNRRSLESRRAWLFRVVPEDEFVAQDVVATDGANGVLAEPALARHFSGHGGLMSGDRIREFRAQVKITADAFVVQATEAEHRLRVIKVHHVFDLAAPGDAVGIVIREIHRQGFQRGKHFRETGRTPDALNFLLTVLGAGTYFLLMHNSRFV